jgi:trigger factor
VFDPVATGSYPKNRLAAARRCIASWGTLFNTLRVSKRQISSQRIPEGLTLTSTETTETQDTATESSQALETNEHTHTHEGHEHHHHQAPALNPELTRSITVEAPAEEVAKAYKRVVKRYQKLARIPGFRAGKVPEAMVKSRFAREVREEVLESLVNEKFRSALVDQKMTPISQPQVSEMLLQEGAPLKFQATFEVMPEVSVAGYDSVKVQRPDSSVTDEEYQAELANVLDHHATVETVGEDRGLVDGDWAEIEFKGTIQDLAQTVGEEGIESKGEAQPITGENVDIEVGGKNTLAAFNEALRGAKAGQELSFEASYPPEFGDARLAGKTVSYDVTVKAIKKKTLPERDEEFAKQLGPYSSFEDFETKLRERLADRKKEALEAQARDRMLDEMIAKFQFPVPESFVQQQIDARLERGLRALAQQGMTADAMRQMDFGRMREAQREQAINEVKASIVLDRIADQETISVDEEEIEREMMMMSLQSREPLEALRKRITDDGTLARMKEQMRREKTGAMLFDRLAS